MIPVFPHCVLRPQQIAATVVPFTRSGGRTLGGITSKLIGVFDDTA